MVDVVEQGSRGGVAVDAVVDVVRQRDLAAALQRHRAGADDQIGHAADRTQRNGVAVVDAEEAAPADVDCRCGTVEQVAAADGLDHPCARGAQGAAPNACALQVDVEAVTKRGDAPAVAVAGVVDGRVLQYQAAGVGGAQDAVVHQGVVDTGVDTAEVVEPQRVGPACLDDAADLVLQHHSRVLEDLPGARDSVVDVVQHTPFDVGVNAVVGVVRQRDQSAAGQRHRAAVVDDQIGSATSRLQSDRPGIVDSAAGHAGHGESGAVEYLQRVACCDLKAADAGARI